MLKLIAVMELSVVRGSVDPHFVDDFEPAVSQPAQGIGVTLVFLAMMLVVKLGPDTTRQALIGKEVEGVTEVFITSPALMNVPEFASFS